MAAVLILCVLSTVVFCFCTRALVIVATTAGQIPFVGNRHGYSVRAWRLARLYVGFSLLLLSAVAFVGVVKSYFELFTLNF